MSMQTETKKNKNKKESPLALIFLIIALLFFLISVLPDQMIMKYVGIKPYVIASNSMKGKLEVGDVVIVKRTAVKDLKTWDIITFYRETTEGKKVLVTHYLADVVKNGDDVILKTKSNIATAWDNWDVTESDLVGKTVLRIPYLGQAALALRNPLLLINAIVIVVLMYAGFSLILIKSKNDKSQKNQE